jgi:hypothetical protein
MSNAMHRMCQLRSVNTAQMPDSAGVIPIGTRDAKVTDESEVRASEQAENRRSNFMCASCGCGKPDDQHGDNRHITLQAVKDAASAADITAEEVVKNLGDSVKQESSGSAD